MSVVPPITKARLYALDEITRLTDLICCSVNTLDRLGNPERCLHERFRVLRKVGARVRVGEHDYQR